MRSIESEGENIDDAIASALRTLNVERDQVAIEILNDATRGLFGFGGTKARVRATVRAPLGRPGEAEHPADDSRETLARVVRPTPTTAPSASAESFAARSRTVLAELLSHLGAVVTVDVRVGDEPGVTVLEVTGDSGGLLIGRRGQTLDALEYIVNR